MNTVWEANVTNGLQSAESCTSLKWSWLYHSLHLKLRVPRNAIPSKLRWLNFFPGYQLWEGVTCGKTRLCQSSMQKRSSSIWLIKQRSGPFHRLFLLSYPAWALAVRARWGWSRPRCTERDAVNPGREGTEGAGISTASAREHLQAMREALFQGRQCKTCSQLCFVKQQLRPFICINLQAILKRQIRRNCLS